MAGIALTDHPERFQVLRRVYVGGVPYELESVWYHRDQPIFKFKGVDSISVAGPLAGSELTLPAEERFPLEQDEFYLSDLVGCLMLDDSSGREVGRVTGWQETGGPVLLEVDDGKILVPFVKSILKKIDAGAGVIRADLPEGLEDLNR